VAIKITPSQKKGGVFFFCFFYALALKLGVSVGVSEALVVVAATSMLVRRLLTRLCACVGEMWRASSSCQMDLHKSTAHHITHTHTCFSFRLSLYACVCVCVRRRSAS